MSEIKNVLREILSGHQEKQKASRKKLDVEQLEEIVIRKVGSHQYYGELGGYRMFRDSYLELCEEFVIIPVKTNGKTNEKRDSLHKFWWLEPKYDKNQWDRKDILILSSVLNIDYYLKNKAYQTEEELKLVYTIYEYMKKGRPKVTLCREERSLMMFNQSEHLTEMETEKYLASREGRALLKRLELDERELGFEVVKEPFIYWENEKAPLHHRKEVLIVEGLATFHTLKKILQKGFSWNIGPIPYLLIWGAGHRIEGTIPYLEDIVEDPNELTIRYAGDIDYTGFDIFYNLQKKNKHLSLHLAYDLYQFLCSFGQDYAHTIDNEQVRKDSLLAQIQIDFNDYPECYQVIEHLWKNRLRIPQELLNLETLIRKGLLDHV
ncbi:DUF2220 domain-containing protein [Cytobacillus oceanisediminis]|uniref:Wadjet anti-phage system protein JetD domain-containing protein n=1 Tax=Cytobacillus oceanisediminis TaxID=665099 RepID=UPI001C233216|nr:Wadjet anti-phage system protein JetD domain-containing protein [Cytobacillus oceanisediminis]MBU8729730.1 DUF2220 domain-containing protein [Cytobacillus oceanisediminis]